MNDIRIYEKRLAEIILRGYELRAMLCGTELRYNPYHDPKTGRFCSGKGLDNPGGSGIIKKEDLRKYIGQPITDGDNQHVREWYYANVTDIPNQVDVNLPLDEQAKQAFELRNKYKSQARIAMTDAETVKQLEEKRPVPTFEELLESKMKRKGMTKQKAIEDILKTAPKTNPDVNKEFGL